MHRIPRRLFPLLLAVLLGPVRGTAWDYVTPAASGGYPAFLVFDQRGGVISLGQHGSELAVARHRSGSGTIIWSHPLQFNGLSLTASSLARVPAGRIVAAGYRGHDAATFSSSVVLVQALSGTIVWKVDLPGARILSVAPDAAGDVIAAGSTVGTRPGDPDDQDLIAIKLSGAEGKELWRFTVDGGGDLIDSRDGELAREVAVDSSGDVHLAGHLVLNETLGYPDFAVLKLAGSDGTLVWQHLIPSVLGHGGSAYGVAFTPEGDIVATGNAVLSNGWCDIVVAKLAAADGSELWRHVLDSGPSSCDLARDLVVDSSGDVVVAASPQNVLFSVLKLSGGSGAKIWRRDLPNGGTCLGGACAGSVGVALDPSGNVVALGKVENDPSDMSVAKLAPSDGSIIWRRDIDLDGCDDVPWSFGIDTKGDIAVAGAGFLKVGGQCAWPQGGNLHVAKVTGATGKEFWDGCGDDLDNDGDGLVDLADPQCSSPQDSTETTYTSCGLGAELLPALAVLWVLRRRRATGRDRECSA